MDQQIRQALQDGGMDVEGVYTRFSRNEAMMFKYLRRFPEDPSYQSFQDAMAAKDMENAIIAVHTLKGVAGNLGWTALYDRASEATNGLRAGEDISAVQQELDEEYHRVIDLIFSTL